MRGPPRPPLALEVEMERRWPTDGETGSRPAGTVPYALQALVRRWEWESKTRRKRSEINGETAQGLFEWPGKA